MKPVNTLYCICDDAGFRLLRGAAGAVPEVLSEVRAADLPGVDHAFASHGRNRTGSVSFGHDKGSEAEIERPRLARHVVAALQAEWDRGRAGRIVIAAGPKMLGALRDAIPKALSAHVAAEVHKDLSDVPAHGLREHLDGL